MSGPIDGRPIDVSALPRLHTGREAPVWWGIAGLIVIEAMLAASLIASYFYLRIHHAVWPPAGVAVPDLLWPGIELVLLLSGCVMLWGAGRALERGRRMSFVMSVFVSLILIAAVPASRWRQFEAVDFRWDSHPYGSIVWTVAGFHSVQVISLVLWIAVIALLGLGGAFTPRRRIAVVVVTLYGWFVALTGIPLYLVLYGSPRWL